MTRGNNESGFGQSDPTDGRKQYDWRSRYADPIARKEIRFEAGFLAFLLFGLPVIMGLLWLEYPNRLMALPQEKYHTLVRYGFAWLAGTLGGVLFALKWLYHSVARGTWHLDRRLWRFFAPHISGGLSFASLALVASGVLRVFDTKAVRTLPVIVGLGFLVGYFSDSAIAKLTEIADTLFGTVLSKEKHGVPEAAPPDAKSDDGEASK